MKHHVKRMIDKGITAAEDSGYPKIEHSDKVPESEVYTLYQMRNSNPRATSTHSKLPFLRQHCVNVAVERMKNRCIYPSQHQRVEVEQLLAVFLRVPRALLRIGGPNEIARIVETSAPVSMLWIVQRQRKTLSDNKMSPLQDDPGAAPLWKVRTTTFSRIHQGGRQTPGVENFF